jgi:PAS domain S-box-containing protein
VQEQNGRVVELDSTQELDGRLVSACLIDTYDCFHVLYPIPNSRGSTLVVHQHSSPRRGIEASRDLCVSHAVSAIPMTFRQGKTYPLTHMERAEGISGSLSARERQLLVMASEGFTDNAISHRLGISLATVGTYWGRIRIKFGPLNRTELVAVFLREQASITMTAIREENQSLLAQLEEHAHTEAMLKTSLELFRALFESAPDAIMLVDAGGKIQIANDQAEAMFGYSHNEMLGLDVDELVPEGMREAHAENRQLYRLNPTKRRMGEHLATVARRKDGSEFHMAGSLSATETRNGLLVTCIVRELTGSVNDPGVVEKQAR